MERNNACKAISQTEEEKILSQRLGRYQQMEKVYRVGGLLGIVCGMLAFFLIEEPVWQTILVLLLFGGGLFTVLFLRSAVQKKQKELLEGQFSPFFQEELEKAFGPALESSEMRIDAPLMKGLQLLPGHWEVCKVDHFYEGIYENIHFSVGNVRLIHVYTRGNIQEGKIPCEDMVFRGIVVRLKTSHPAPGVICVPEKCGEASCPVEQEQTVRDLQAWLHDFGKIIEGKVHSIYWEDHVLTMAMETDYSFASVASHVDQSDWTAVRQSYRRSLEEMGKFLTLVQTRVGSDR